MIFQYLYEILIVSPSCVQIFRNLTSVKVENQNQASTIALLQEKSNQQNRWYTDNLIALPDPRHEISNYNFVPQQKQDTLNWITRHSMI